MTIAILIPERKIPFPSALEIKINDICPTVANSIYHHHVGLSFCVRNDEVYVDFATAICVIR